MIYDVLPVSTYRGNNSCTKFDFNFFIENENQLEVYLIDENNIRTKLNLYEDYLINETKNKNGSFITFPAEGSKYNVLSHEEKISIELYLECIQEIQYNNSSLLNLESLEYSFDYLTRLIQILQRRINLCVKVPEGSGIQPEALLKDFYDKLSQAQKHFDNTKAQCEDILHTAEKLSADCKNLEDFFDEKTDEINDIFNEAKKLLPENILNTSLSNITAEGIENIKKYNPHYNLFDILKKDHILSFEELSGLERLGQYVYKEGVSDSRYGYPDFYEKCLEEYFEATDKVYSIPFVVPDTSSNGVLGRDSFAIEAGDYQNIYNAINSLNTTNIYSTSSSQDITFYNPRAIKVTKIVWNVYDNNRNPAEYTIEACNDGENYTTISTGTAAPSSSTIMDLSDNDNYYKYYKLKVSAFNSGQGNLKTLLITAQEFVFPFKENLNGHKFYDIKDKEKIDEIYQKTGIAWYYGIDEENERIFLPRIDIINLNKASKIPVVGNGYSLVMQGKVGEETKYGVWQAMNGWPASRFRMNPKEKVLIGTTQFEIECENYDQQYTGGTSFGVSERIQDCSLVALLNDIENHYPTSPFYIYMVVGNAEIKKAQSEIIDITSSENDTIPLFTAMHFDFKPNHVSWLKAGAVASGKIYVSAYNELVKVLKGEETKCGVDLKAIGDKQKLSDTDYSQYWIINENEQTFKAPAKTSFLNNSGLYFKVSNAVQNLALTDAGTVLEELNNKVDLKTAASSSFPSDRHTFIALGVSGASYTAPADGYFMLYIRNLTKAGFVSGVNTTSGYILEIRCTVLGGVADSVIPAQKGENVLFYYDASGDVTFMFMYAEGAK